MKRSGPFTSLLAAVALLSGCGGGGGGGSGGSSSGGGGTAAPSPAPTPSPTPPPSTACSLSARQQWVLGQLNEWYLFPDLLATATNPASFSNLDDYVDALAAPARAQSRDRFFTYVTSIKEEDAYYEEGMSAGLGVRFGFDSAARRLYVLEAYEGAPGLAAGMDRGTEVIAIGTTNSNLQTVSALYASGGTRAVSEAMGPDTPGTTRVLQLRQLDSTVTTVSVSKRDFVLPPVSSRYGAKVIGDGGRRVGYVNLRTFVITADPALRAALDSFKAQGITEVIVDLRYNGGGLVSVAELFSDLLNAQRAGQVQSRTTFRESKASENSTQPFTSQPQAIAATKVAFIGTGSTASASELVINAQRPYLGANAALIGSNTYGKPVGQIALDRPECDDRLRAVAFRTENAQRDGDYYTGLAARMEATCQAGDDITYQLGDPRESSIRTALDFLAGRTCTRIQTSGVAQQSVAPRRVPLESATPNAAQRELPGLF
jgi:C-terminal processing protease CtpA/Prc